MICDPLLVPQSRHGVNARSSTRRDVAGDQRGTKQQNRDSGKRCEIHAPDSEQHGSHEPAHEERAGQSSGQTRYG
jgi:hypothetical protein